MDPQSVAHRSVDRAARARRKDAPAPHADHHGGFGLRPLGKRSDAKDMAESLLWFQMAKFLLAF